MVLSVIVVSFNSKDILKKSLAYLESRLKENFPSPADYEVIVVDNASSDGVREWLSGREGVKIALLKENVGFGRANNVGLELASGEFVLFLNSDVYLEENIDFQELTEFLRKDDRRGALAIKLHLGNQKLDPACHRGFPTPWNAFAYFSGLEKMSRRTFLKRYFGGYHLTHMDLDSIHEIDCPSAAFFLAKRKIIDHIGGFDPDYFFYAEDIDLCYRIKALGYSIWFYPRYFARHLKYQSGQKSSRKEVKRATREQFFTSMLMFYEKRYLKRYPWLVNQMVKAGVRGLLAVNRLLV